MYNSLILMLIIIFCHLCPGIECQTLYDYPYNFERDSIHQSFNLELSKITHQVQIGCDVQLDCGISDNQSAIILKSPVSWHFKSCGHGFCWKSTTNRFNQSSCHKAIESQDSTNWHKLECLPDSNCNSSLVIMNLTEKDSGLYRCSIYPFKPNGWTTLQIQVVKTYFLDVRNTTIAPPDIVDEQPRNTTALIDSQVVLQCFVHSRVQPRITWFKKQETPLTSPVDDLNITNRVIEYSENVYVQLESAGEKVLSDGVYLSKLILNGITEKDGGFYVCVAINYGGYKMQEAYLTVLDTDDERTDDNDLGNSTQSLLLLFLFPVGLAIAPLSLWICYLVFRERKVKEVDERTDNRNDYIRVNKNIV